MAKSSTFIDTLILTRFLVDPLEERGGGRHVLSKITLSKIFVFLSYPLQTAEDFSIYHILKVMIMRVGVPWYAGHFQGVAW